MSVKPAPIIAHVPGSGTGDALVGWIKRELDCAVETTLSEVTPFLVVLSSRNAVTMAPGAMPGVFINPIR